MSQIDRIRAIIGDYLDLSDQRSAQMMRLIEAEIATPADQTAGSKFGSIFPRKSPEEVSRDPAYRKVQQELSGLRVSIEQTETAPAERKNA